MVIELKVMHWPDFLGLRQIGGVTVPSNLKATVKILLKPRGRKRCRQRQGQRKNFDNH